MLFACPASDDFFRSGTDRMIDLRPPLTVLVSLMPWQGIKSRVAYLCVRKVDAGEATPGLGVFGQTQRCVVTRRDAGRLRVPLRVTIALLYLRHAFNKSGKGVVHRWADAACWQFFWAQADCEDGLPCDATTLVTFRRLLGEEGAQELFARTVNQAVIPTLFLTEALATLVVHTNMQEKAIAHPTSAAIAGFMVTHDLRTRKTGDLIVADGRIDVDAALSVEASHGMAVEACSRVLGRHRVLNRMTHVYPWQRPDMDKSVTVPKPAG